MSGLERKSVRLADEVSTERFCPSFLEMDNSMERNVIRRVITVDTNEIHSNVHNLAGDGLVINKSKIDFLPLECIQRGLKVAWGRFYITPRKTSLVTDPNDPTKQHGQPWGCVDKAH
jgi:RNase P protein component